MKFFTNSRSFFKATTKTAIIAGIGLVVAGSLLQSCSVLKKNQAVKNNILSTGYAQKALPYAYGALEPVIDAQTMEIHYTKHAAGYAKALVEEATAANVNMSTTSVETLLSKISKYSTKMRNNAGGHYNHELFWQTLTANGKNTPSGSLLTAIEAAYGSFAEFKTKFEDAAKTRFGSGWAWLIVETNGKLKITSTANQDNPLMDVADVKGTPLLGLDVWEHAYYLKYQNKRPDYVSNWWMIINWDYVQSRYEAVIK